MPFPRATMLHWLHKYDSLCCTTMMHWLSFRSCSSCNASPDALGPAVLRADLRYFERFSKRSKLKLILPQLVKSGKSDPFCKLQWFLPSPCHVMYCFKTHQSSSTKGLWSSRTSWRWKWNFVERDICGYHGGCHAPVGATVGAMLLWVPCSCGYHGGSCGCCGCHPGHIVTHHSTHWYPTVPCSADKIKDTLKEVLKHQSLCKIPLYLYSNNASETIAMEKFRALASRDRCFNVFQAFLSNFLHLNLYCSDSVAPACEWGDIKWPHALSICRKLDLVTEVSFKEALIKDARYVHIFDDFLSVRFQI